MAFQLLDLTEHDIRELKQGLELREKELKKIRKACDEAGLSTTDADWHLDIIRGDVESPGILYRVQSQLDAIYESSLEPKHGDQMEMDAEEDGDPFPDPEAEAENDQPDGQDDEAA